MNFNNFFCLIFESICYNPSSPKKHTRGQNVLINCILVLVIRANYEKTVILITIKTAFLSSHKIIILIFALSRTAFRHIIKLLFQFLV